MSNTKRTHGLFTPSGCLTVEALQKSVSSMLTAEEQEVVDMHLVECELCREALDGLALLPGIDRLDSTVDAINENLKESFFPKSSKNPIKIIWSNNRVFYFSAAASVLILIGIFSFLMFYIEDSDSKISVVTEKQVDKNQKPQTFLPEKENSQKPVSEFKNYPEKKENEIITDQVIKPEQKKIVQIVEDDSELERDNVKNIETLDDFEEEVLSPPMAIVETEESVEIVKKEDVLVADEVMERNAEGMIVELEATGSKKSKGNRDQKESDEYIGLAEASMVADTSLEDKQVFIVIEQQPEFPGGEKELDKFLSENIKYPRQAIEDSIQGKVFVTFVVEKDGKITDARVLRGIGGGCDEEALRVIKKMPKWIPGKQRGKAVRVQFNLPIAFIIN